jgi:hypothetical protein
VNDFEKLKAALLALGGLHVSDFDTDGVSSILRHGRRAECRVVKLLPGLTGECHKNSIAIAEQRPDLAFWTGFALMPDDTWVRHSWLIDESGTLFETTVVASAYFGHVLGRELELRVFAARVNSPSAELLAKLRRLAGE